MVGVTAIVAPPARAQRPAYPPSEARPVTERVHGETITDPYRWLEDQESPETRGWIDAQNRFREEVMADVPGVEGLKERLGDLLETDQMSAPTVRGERYFFSKRAAGQDLYAMEAEEFTLAALRQAAQRDRLNAVQGPDGLWRSSRRSVEADRKAKHKRKRSF